MKEDFIHYLWKFKKFKWRTLYTSDKLKLNIINFGIHNTSASGPDFFNAQVEIGEELWAGNVEMHLKASDWYAHHHERDPAYDSVILHVVWDDDVAVFRKNGAAVPTLEIANFTEEDQLQKYRALIDKRPNDWIYCQNSFSNFDELLLGSWLERVYIERLEDKSALIFQLLEKSTNNWDEVLFKLLAKNFGLNVNGSAFIEMAETLPFGVVRRTAENLTSLEALFFGQLNILNEEIEEPYYINLKKEYSFLKHKYQLKNKMQQKPQFFRLRPGNFPTIRLAQLAALYHRQKDLFHIFTSSMDCNTISSALKVKPSSFWETHYTFTATSKSSAKQLTGKFINLLLINTFIPFRFAYAKSKGKDENEFLLDVMRSIPAEKNQIITKFEALRKGVSKNALHSQGLKQLKTQYCDRQKCMSCNLGIAYLK